MTNVRFIYDGVAAVVQCEPVIYDVIAKATLVAGWPEDAIVDARTTSPTTWAVTAQGEIVTAEGVDA